MPISAEWVELQKKALEQFERDPNPSKYDKIFNKFVWTEPAKSWQDFRRWLTEVEGWGFRGQRETAWTLQTSFERITRVKYSRGDISGSFQISRRPQEQELLLSFQQQAHDHIPHLPSGDDVASWVAMMQHLGVPTRFLDWTLSPYVAMWFALEKEPQEDEKLSAVWALDLRWLKEKEEESLGPMPDDPKARIEYRTAVLSQQKEPVIIRIDPPQPNERMLAQKGFLLWKLLDETPLFDTILTSMMLHDMQDRPVIRKLEIGEDLRIEFLENLRAMDIHRSALFPGSDDFCEPIRRDLEIKVAHEAALASGLER